MNKPGFLLPLRSLLLRLSGTVAFRLALGYGALLVVSMGLMSAVLYFGTVGLLSRNIDTAIINTSQRLKDHYATGGMEKLSHELQQILDDGINSDTEVYLLTTVDGKLFLGNITDWPQKETPPDRLSDHRILRSGKPSISRLLPHRLPNGSLLVVGRDLSVVGFDDVTLASWPSFMLTTYSQPIQAMVRRVVEITLNHVTHGGSEPIREVIPGVLIVRTSARLPR